MINFDEEFVTAEDVAGYFGVSIHAVYKWARQGRIATRRLGRAVRITRSEFEYLKVHGLREPEMMENKITLAVA